jgi:alpha-D-xyloside xylohydrolase
MFLQDGQALLYKYGGETLRIEPWGENSLRVRATRTAQIPTEDWALLPVGGNGQVVIGGGGATVANGNITAFVDGDGMITFRNGGGVILMQEYRRRHGSCSEEYISALEIGAREFKPVPGGDFELTARFLSLDKDEKIYGMGQYQQPYLDIKGMEIELSQRNSQASVPFCVSGRGYGMLWNNPAIGRACFGRNIMTWYAASTKAMDYWITAGDTPSEIVERYASVTGTVPMLPEYAAGFWQSKLRYQTQEELLKIAREYKRRELPLSVIVIDYFHWPAQGDWRFDPIYWPDPDAMIAELKDMEVELAVSIWPTVDFKSENFQKMKECGYLISTERGLPISMSYFGDSLFADVSNPEAREYMWDKVQENYYEKGIKTFWLDVAEPEFLPYDFDHYRWHLGPYIQAGNCYPAMYAKAIFDGMKANGESEIVSLTRCAWAGSQRYGTLLWSGDIRSTFESLRMQLPAGLNAGLAGIPWWTTDIGGFDGGDPEDPKFRELFARWFAFGAFSPIMRLHGTRLPLQPQAGTTGGAECRSGAPNEVWSYGGEVYEICKKYLAMREKMRPYIMDCMKLAHKKGTPVIRPLFYDAPQDSAAWDVEDQYMFGPDVLVAPVMETAARSRSVYLPAGAQWRDVWSGNRFDGGQTVEVAAPLDVIPLFLKNGAEYDFVNGFRRNMDYGFTNKC